MAGTRPLTDEEQTRLMTALPRLRDRLLVLCGLFTGFRVGELLKLKVGDVWSDGAPRPTVKIARRFLKGGRGRRKKGVVTRVVPMHSALRAVISSYVADRYGVLPPDPDDFLFRSRKGANAPISFTQAWRLLTTAAALSGIFDRIATHSLRKTFVRSIYELTGHDLCVTQEAVGHKSPLTTRRYLDENAEKVQTAIMGIRGPGLLSPVPAENAPPELRAG